ncbi:hypothetical protein BGZ80_007832 [Entomortierella chlamydospora]|uniref:Fe2OG dioxygenase domain-containing protein n=1 Tax=Entomortierella chlamydospora TaxID=101097 RepID=A0A9P6MXT4_9FUNG|nr:hypothetical protein BGZ79_008616 [Entomortierella chlamydospora]KAG0017860.1 hypothetical protein BGZ80_007832 [Entomortierella chlamydospora]
MSVHSPRNTVSSVLPKMLCLSAKDNSRVNDAARVPMIRTLSLKDYLCPEARPHFLREMRESLVEIGTFYIKDHGVPTQVTEGVMRTMRDYFALPLAEKKKMLIGNSRHFRGYKLMGEERTNNQVDHREQLQFGPEQSSNEDFMPSASPEYQGLKGPNQWPSTTLALMPEFKTCILEYMRQLETLSQHLMEALALSLNLEATYFRDLFGETPYYRLKCAKYPSVQNAATVGCGAHKDTGFLTVLFQDMVSGLQGEDPVTGRWMDTRPVPETFIVTMGESIEKLTGGLYHATVHRVLNNTSGQDRYSIPFFFDPTLEAEIPYCIPLVSHRGFGPSLSAMPVSDSSVDEDLESLVDRFDINDNGVHNKNWSNGKHIFETVQRCHPEVYSRWYNL